MNRIDLDGRVAIVTGGAAGIGLACAQRFLQSGARVSVWDYSEENLQTAAAALAPHGRIDTRRVDVSIAAEVRQAADAVKADLGGIDILVNSAGVSGRFVPAVDYPLEDWQRQVAVNLIGTFLCCQAVLPAMLAKGYGRIVNVSSMAGKEGNPNAVAYSSVKAGVIGMTKSLGKELGAQGIIVNCVTPTIFDTPMHRRTAVNMPAEQLAALKAKIPIGRIGRPDEAASMIAWLCSEECSFSTGAVFDLSGGRATY